MGGIGGIPGRMLGFMEGRLGGILGGSMPCIIGGGIGIPFLTGSSFSSWDFSGGASANIVWGLSARESGFCAHRIRSEGEDRVSRVFKRRLKTGIIWVEH